jgi:hypothetical protein
MNIGDIVTIRDGRLACPGCVVTDRYAQGFWFTVRTPSGRLVNMHRRHVRLETRAPRSAGRILEEGALLEHLRALYPAESGFHQG